jgi:outer membrane phospholipase A
MQLWGTFHTRNERLQVTALVNPTVTFTKFNAQVEASWRLAKRGDWLPSLFVQYSYGYGETMIDYNHRASKIRIGISLMNNRLNLY